MDKELTWEEELEEARAEQPGPQSCIAAQNPLGPSRSRLRRQIATFRGDAVRLLKDARQVLVEIGYLAGDQIEALRTSFDRACVTLPDGRRLLATDHAALIAFAMANKIPEEMLWERITVRQHGRVTEGRFNHLRVTDITALPGCTKIEDLQLDRNEIEDISPLANCGALVTLCALLEPNHRHLSPGELRETRECVASRKQHHGHFSAGELQEAQVPRRRRQPNHRYLSLGTLPKALGGSLAVNEITDISVLESCPRLEIVEVFDNPLSGEAAAVIAKLRARGVACLLLKGGLFTACASSPATHDVPI